MLIHEAWKWRSLLCVCAELCLTLSDRMNHSPPASSVHGLLQARLLMWVAGSYSRGSLQTPHSSHLPLVLLLSFFFFSFSRPVHGTFLCLKFSSSYRDLIKETVCLVTQSCLDLRNPLYCSPPASSVHGISRQEY